jgi:CRISPR-associated endonuclease/helicase Cas3
VSAFPDWYAQRHGHDPFPWQAGLAARIALGDWPAALTPPTGSGKTGVIDVWLWAWLQGHPVPRRLVYVIDRRLVVDGVARYAERLTATLPKEQRPPVIQMRGGISIDNDWVQDPSRPAVLISTVDQAGSRLLFSGYGVSPKAAPVHAALLGNDALWVLDEVHLARPLLQTLEAVTHLRGSAIGLPLRVLPMSATWAGANGHGLGDADRCHPVLAPRLRHPKPAAMLALKADGDLVLALAEQARLLRREGASVVAVVCNRVATARAVYDHLAQDAEAVLLTGRIRPADKDVLLAEYLPRMAAGSRAAGRKPLFVVATQTIEVGADLDFDALVTEAAPLSALRQRAGRLNRLGELASAPITLVYRPTKDDPVYGQDIKAAWDWLGKVARRKVVDFGIAALEEAMAGRAPPDEVTATAPVLLESHAALLARTGIPHGMDVAPWLHGWQRGAPDVHLCWRADADPESLAAAPPRQHELLAVPLWAARQWSDDVSDVETAVASADRAGQMECLRWDGEQAERISLRQARVGDTLVLPCNAGGCDRFGWAPRSLVPVTDVGDDARRVRLHPAVHPELSPDIAALLGTEATASDWQRLALRAGLTQPGRVIAIPGGSVVLCRQAWTSESALRAVTLPVHVQAVAAHVLRLAQALGLADAALLESLRRAGVGHDAGKADLRWQARVGGSRDNLLAKGPQADDPWMPLPRGWRHEMASVARLEQTDDLARYLVGTHHGHGRPMFPAAPDVALWRQMGDWAGLQARLLQHWGPWGLALLESLLRLSDWAVSEAEQADEDD